MAVFEGSDACVAPVLADERGLEHPHLVARDTFVERDGEPQPAPAPRFSVTPAGPVAAAPARGQDDPAAIAARWRREAAAAHDQEGPAAGDSAWRPADRPGRSARLAS